MNHVSVSCQKARMGQGDAVVHISARNLAQLDLLLPKPDEQSAIAAILFDMDRDIAALEARRDKVRDVYDGPQGALLATASMLSGHVAYGDRLLRQRKFDLRGAKQILDVGSGAGQIARHLLKYADHDAQLTCFDLSLEMMRRARTRLKSAAPRHLVADLTRLPFADGAFDCVTCGYVLEHLPEAHSGLSELSRVMRPGARMLLLATEDNFGGAWTSRFWCCRTYNRRELYRTSHELGLVWKKELWWWKPMAPISGWTPCRWCSNWSCCSMPAPSRLPSHPARNCMLTATLWERMTLSRSAIVAASTSRNTFAPAARRRAVARPARSRT